MRNATAVRRHAGLAQLSGAERSSMPSHLPSLASLLLGILLVAPLLRFARGLAEPICAGDLDTRASERWASIRVAESPDHAALYSDWPTSRTSPGRIDTHQHYIPQFYADYLEKYNDSGLHLPWGTIIWTSGSALAFMDRLGIEKGIISISTPGIPYGDMDEVKDMARRVNEFGAKAVQENTSRFGLFASLPVPYMDAALEEIAYALDELGAAGVTLQANMHGKYLGEDLYEPMWAELNKRGAVVFIHPNQLPGPPVKGIIPAAVDFLADTTRTVLSMLDADILSRYKAVKVITAHGGAFVPYQAYRLAAVGPKGLSGAPERRQQLQSLYFDSTMAGNEITLPSLMAFTSGHRVMFGSDFPFAPEGTAVDSVSGLDDYFSEDLVTLWRISRGTALHLVPGTQAKSSS